jgi:prefoldin subunit 5
MGNSQEHPQRIRSSGPKEKHAHLTKWHALTLGLVILVIVEALFSGFLLATPRSDSESYYETLYEEYLLLQSQFETLKEQYDSLNSEYVSLKASYDELNMSQDSSDSLEAQYNFLQSRYDELNSEYDSLNSQYLSLQSSYDALDFSYDSLNSQHLSLQASYDSLQSQFAALQDSYDAVTSEYEQIRDQVNQRAQHYGVDEFITPNDASVQQITNYVTGGWSNQSDWDEYWTDIKALYDWVVNNIEYNYDGLFPVLPSSLSGSVFYTTEMWQFPNETLNLKKGDCEDMAILLCSLIRGYSQEYWTECLLIIGSKGGHAAVQIPVSGDKMVILDAAGNYYTSDVPGEIASKDISTEIDSWLTYWKPQLGNDVRVYRVFSDYMDTTFASTSEYTSWMYSRP